MQRVRVVQQDREIGMRAPARPVRARARVGKIGRGAMVRRVRIRPFGRGSRVLPVVCRVREMTAGEDRGIGERRRPLPDLPESAESVGYGRPELSVSR